MTWIVLLALPVLLIIFFGQMTDRREREMAERLERAHKKLRGTEAAGFAEGGIDAAIVQSRVEAQAIRDFTNRG